MGTEAPDSKTSSPPLEPVAAERALARARPTVWQRVTDHKVAQWTLAYAAAAYTLLHGAEMLAGALDWPHILVRVLTLVLLLGAPVTATLAWYHGHRAQHRVSGPELAILTALLVIAGSVLWLLGRTPHVAPTTTAETVPATASQAPATSVVPSDKSIAVLPFVDMSEKKDQEYFADGMAEELIDLLAQVQDLQVIARTSSFYFKGRQVTIADIAKKLGVSHILEGSVRKVGNRIRVTVQLIRADRDLHQWSQTYDRNVKDIFQVQDEIAGAVVGTLKLKLLPAQQILNPYRSGNPDAYNQYLLGRQFQKRANTDGDRRAADAYRKAIELDPRYAAAYAGLASAENTLADFSTDPIAAQQQALADAEQSVALAPSSAVGYAARGAMRLSYSWDWAGAQADLEKALALDASDTSAQLGYGSVLATLGRLPEAIAATKRATELDPLSTRAWQSLDRLLTANHQFSDAREANRRLLEIEPEDSYGLNDLGRIQLFEHQAAQALATFRRVGISEFRLMGVAIAEHTLGHAKESQRALDELMAKGAVGWAYQVAEVFAWRGQKDKAFEWLDRAYEQHDTGLSDIKVSPTIIFSRLPSDPRYGALLRKMNLPE